MDNSKSILETILSKIKLYEKGHFKKLDEVLKVGDLHLTCLNTSLRGLEASIWRQLREVSCPAIAQLHKMLFVLATGNSN